MYALFASGGDGGGVKTGGLCALSPFWILPAKMVALNAARHEI